MNPIGYTDAHLVLQLRTDAYGSGRKPAGLDSATVARFFDNIKNRGLHSFKFTCCLSGEQLEVMTHADGNATLVGGQA